MTAAISPGQNQTKKQAHGEKHTTGLSTERPREGTRVTVGTASLRCITCKAPARPRRGGAGGGGADTALAAVAGSTNEEWSRLLQVSCKRSPSSRL